MRPVLNGIAIMSTIVAIALALNLYLGWMSGAYGGTTGDSTIGMQLLALIAASLAMATGFVGRILDRRTPRPASRVSNMSVAIGMLAGLLVLGIPFVFS